MKIQDVATVVEGTPYMSVRQAERITAIIEKHDCRRILELGFAHGVSTCYLAAAIDELGEGRVWSIDKAGSARRVPTAEELLERCGLRDYVELIREPRSFTWRLMKWLDEGWEDTFDFVYLDGGHSWDVTGYAFFLVDRLLAPGGWLVFDDIDWTHSTNPHFKGTEALAKMPPDYRDTPQVRKVFELLVAPHPGYVGCEISGGWGIAQKRPSPRRRLVLRRPTRYDQRV